MKTYLEKEIESDKKITNLRSVLGFLLALLGVTLILSIWMPPRLSWSLVISEDLTLLVFYVLERKRYREIRSKYLG